MAEEKDSHRHILPGNILTGPPTYLEEGDGDVHKHMLVGGQGVTSANAGKADDNHRHTANGQGMSGPTNNMKDTQLPDKKANLEEK